MSRRGFGDDAIYFDHLGDCRDARHHKGCAGRWRGAVSAGYDAEGKRIRRKVSGPTKQDVKDKLKEPHGDLDAGLPSADGRYTVRQAVADWLREGLDGRSENTVAMNRHVLQPVVASLGRIQVRQLTTRDVRRVLAEIAETRSSPGAATTPRLEVTANVWVARRGDLLSS